MRYVKMILMAIVVIIFIFGLHMIYFRLIPDQPNANISQAQLKSNINRIARSYTNMFANCEIWDENDKLRFKNSNIPIIDNMKNDQVIISISGSDEIKKNLSYREVYGIFESWLFIINKKMPYDVIAICWGYTSGGLDNTNSQTTIITRTEFEELYNNVDTMKYNQKEAAKALADKWIEETGYEKK